MPVADNPGDGVRRASGPSPSRSVNPSLRLPAPGRTSAKRRAATGFGRRRRWSEVIGRGGRARRLLRIDVDVPQILGAPIGDNLGRSRDSDS
jgi:hypothetical protein